MLNTTSENRRIEDWIAAPTATEQAVAAFAPIALSELGEAELLNRVETKYVVSAEMLPTLLTEIRHDYRVLSIEGQRLNRYKTLYFDSADFTLYHRHHAGAANRYKVRSRQYVETDTTFLELKHKTNKKRTLKQRIPTGDFLRVIDRKSGDFLRARCPHNIDTLYGRLLTYYTRITLVSRHTAERVTIDLDLSFAWESRHEALSDIAIIEVKRAPHSAESAFARQLRTQHVRPARFSKYCIGVSLIYPQVKHNNFKPQLRLLNKLSQGTNHAYQH